MSKIHIVLTFCALSWVAQGQSFNAGSIDRVDPPHWWSHHPISNLDLLFQGSGLFDAQLSKEQGVITDQKSYANGRYLHVQVNIQHGLSDSVLHFTINGQHYPYMLKARSDHRPEGLSPTDLVYLITPDRFANGKPGNDSDEGMREKGVNRAEPYARHGGDLLGIQHAIPYFKDLGVSAIWLNPVLENDMAEQSYHGYAITDHYAVDTRYGGNESLKSLANQLHQAGIKHVADLVLNHWGSEHYLQSELPDSGMVHWNEDGEVPYSSFRFATLTDPHGAHADVRKFQNGWFAGAMPDLDQQHPLTAAYLRMHVLWYVEEFDVDAIRYDTYAFADELFTRKLNHELRRAYPRIFLFGETWAYNETSQAYFAPNRIRDVRPSGLDATTDFTLWRALHEALSPSEAEEYSWDKGAGALYYRLVADLIYARPNSQITFIDNHDDGRFLGQVAGNYEKLKSALTLLYTLRGIPVLYYGTEVGLQGHEDHGAIREDWPGFDGESVAQVGLSPENAALLEFCQELGKMRLAHPWFWKSSLVQYAPENGWYHFTRSYKKSAIGQDLETEYTLHVVYNGTHKARIWSGTADREYEVPAFGTVYFVVAEEADVKN